jgi:hypothetical protein
MRFWNNLNYLLGSEDTPLVSERKLALTEKMLGEFSEFISLKK